VTHASAGQFGIALLLATAAVAGLPPAAADDPVHEFARALQAAPSTGAPALYPGYVLVWADEFDRDGAPDPANWANEAGKPGSLFPALHRLEERGWLASQWGESENRRRAKYYKLTAVGRREIDAELTNWQRIVAAIGWAIKATS
jgi:hypothetical protein